MPLDITNLVPGDIFPPITRIPRGRPKRERIPPGEVRNRARVHQLTSGLPLVPDRTPHHCSTGGQEGHNARACKKPRG
ncbi:hypothetical protein L873DRAFT_1808410 [Choiromyces venosus 120613-1]|uniref:Uncharacterized protein n=1 Tax=Choiromyces venosus 120613-1 TaxID=1336337 RepID=A0A3N4JM77_9PEZI|nr:hypothetical protein L873DRAFT_1808410 [Choiromyces venosus 120613-1]